MVLKDKSQAFLKLTDDSKGRGGESRGEREESSGYHLTLEGEESVSGTGEFALLPSGGQASKPT